MNGNVVGDVWAVGVVKHHGFFDIETMSFCGCPFHVWFERTLGVGGRMNIEYSIGGSSFLAALIVGFDILVVSADGFLLSKSENLCDIDALDEALLFGRSRSLLTTCLWVFTVPTVRLNIEFEKMGAVFTFIVHFDVLEFFVVDTYNVFGFLCWVPVG
jgi:hypothetical protein